MPTSNPQVTVIVPGYNLEACLAETLDSVLAQTMPDFELIVVNDGSTDATGVLADRYAAQDARIQVIHQENAGLSGARNSGYRASNPATRAVIFLDGDDLWEPHTLATLLRALDAHPEALGVYGAHTFFDETGRVWPDTLDEAFGRARDAIVNGRPVAWPVDAPTTFEVLVTWPPIATSGQLLLRRDALKDMPVPFEPGILSEDWLFWLLLTRHGGKLQPHWELLLRKRERSLKLSKGPVFGRAEIIVRRKLLQQPDLTRAQRETAWAGHWHGVWLRLVWARQALWEGQPVEAAKKLRHFGIALGRYLRLRAEFAG
jgi:glycosyltransferase involved in cell wall biosynthesis